MGESHGVLLAPAFPGTALSFSFYVFEHGGVWVEDGDVWFEDGGMWTILQCSQEFLPACKAVLEV